MPISAIQIVRLILSILDENKGEKLALEGKTSKSESGSLKTEFYCYNVDME